MPIHCHFIWKITQNMVMMFSTKCFPFSITKRTFKQINELEEEHTHTLTDERFKTLKKAREKTLAHLQHPTKMDDEKKN